MATLLQSASSNPDTDPATLAFPGNVTAGNALFCQVINVASASVVGITDERGSDWSLVDAFSSSWRVELWRAVSPSGGTNTVTIEFAIPPDSTGVVVLYEFAGMGTPVDGPTNSLVVTEDEDPLRGATLTTTAPGVIFCGIRPATNFSFVAWNNGFIDSGAGNRARTGYRITTGGVSAEPSIDVTNFAEQGISLTCAVYDGASSLAAGLVPSRPNVGAGMKMNEQFWP